MRICKLEKLGPSFSVEFQLKVKSFPRSSMASVLHFTATGRECCEVGDRVPAVFISRRRLYVAYPVEEGGDLIQAGRLRRRRWHSLVISLEKVRSGRPWRWSECLL